VYHILQAECGQHVLSGRNPICRILPLRYRICISPCFFFHNLHGSGGFYISRDDLDAFLIGYYSFVLPLLPVDPERSHSSQCLMDVFPFLFSPLSVAIGFETGRAISRGVQAQWQPMIGVQRHSRTPQRPFRPQI